MVSNIFFLGFSCGSGVPSSVPNQMLSRWLERERTFVLRTLKVNPVAWFCIRRWLNYFNATLFSVFRRSLLHVKCLPYLKM